MTFHAAVLIRIRTGIAVDGDENVRSRSIGFRGFLIGGFVDVLRTGINDAETIAFQNFADSKGEGERIVLFLPAFVYSAGIGATVPCIKKNGVDIVCHRRFTCKGDLSYTIWVRAGPRYRKSSGWRISWRGKEILQYWKAGKLRAPLEYTCFKEKIMVFSKGERKDWTE